jgi:dipeptidyl aminopeptidase/acylaminoacyl peptidase
LNLPTLYQILKAQKIDTQYVKYSDEGHVVEKPNNLKDILERSIKWIDSHMKNQ